MDWRYLLLLLSPPHAHYYLQASGIGIGIGHRIGGIGPQASGASGGRAVYLPFTISSGNRSAGRRRVGDVRHRQIRTTDFHFLVGVTPLTQRCIQE
jgi:hypothetical protein